MHWRSVGGVLEEKGTGMLKIRATKIPMMSFTLTSEPPPAAFNLVGETSASPSLCYHLTPNAYFPRGSSIREIPTPSPPPTV